MKARRALSIWACLLVSNLALTPNANAQTSSSAQRVVSTALCADSYVRAVFTPDQITALSWQSRSELSLASDELKAKAQASADFESLIALDPDLVVFGPGEGGQIAPLFKKLGIGTVTLDWTETIDGLNKNLAKLGQPPLNVPPLSADDKTRPKVLYLSGAGGTAGLNTYIDTAITLAGGKNIWPREGWFAPEPEILLGLKPDMIITSFTSEAYDSAQSRIGRHHLYERLVSTTPHIHIEGKYWPCLNPDFAHNVQRINSALAALPDKDGP